MSAPLAAELRTKYSVRHQAAHTCSGCSAEHALRSAERTVHTRVGSRCACQEGR